MQRPRYNTCKGLEVRKSERGLLVIKTSTSVVSFIMKRKEAVDRFDQESPLYRGHLRIS